MTKFVLIRHESQPDTTEPARTAVEAFEGYYKAKGWKVVEDPAEVGLDIAGGEESPGDESLSVNEQFALLHEDPKALEEALAPTPPEGETGEAKPATTSKRGSSK